MMREPAFSLLKPPAPMALKGKRVLVLGLGDTGLSVAHWVESAGRHRARRRHARRAAAQEGLSRANCITGKFKASLLKDVDLVCISPGLSLEEEVVQAALAKNIPVVGDIELFAWAGDAARCSPSPAPTARAPSPRSPGTCCARRAWIAKSRETFLRRRWKRS